MLPIPRRYSHYVFGVIQSGLTSGLATLVACVSNLPDESFVLHWVDAWLVSWSLMMPVVLFAAPLIRRVATALTRPDATAGELTE